MSEEEIAARLELSLDTVKTGVAAMEAYRQSYSHEIVDMKMNEVVIGQLDGMSNALADGLAAMRLMEETGPNGEPIFEIDHNTRIKMIDAISNLIDKVRPKAGNVTAVNILNQQNNANVNGGGGRSFEARIRAIREQRGLRAADGEVAVIDAEDEGNEPSEDDEILEEGAEEEEVEADYPEEH